MCSSLHFSRRFVSILTQQDLLDSFSRTKLLVPCITERHSYHLLLFCQSTVTEQDPSRKNSKIP